MIGIIFAAGIGSRLKPFTDSHPKALVDLGGVPAIIRVADKLLASGARKLIVNVHHFPEQVIACLEQQAYADLVEISDESSLLLDTGGALAKITRESPTIANADATEPIIVHNADIYTDFDISEMLAAHTRSNADATILVDPHRTSTRHFLFSAGMRLSGWENTAKGLTRPENLDTTGLTAAAFGGVHVITPALMHRISEGLQADILPFSITDWYIQNCGDTFIHGFTPARQYRWHDIGTPEKLEAARKCFI